MGETSTAEAEKNDGTTLLLPSDTDILIRRDFAAPAGLVFEALSKPELVKRWWAPRSRGAIVSVEVDFRVGGEWRFVMRTHRGAEVGFSGHYLEIESPTRIVHTEAFDAFPDAVATVTVTLTERAGKTTMESLSRYPSKAVRDQVVASGMESGMRESMRQLSDVVLGRAGNH
ncbi:MAG: SRPBCC family protein [Archangiaceae bacterium]|nr:SRPBCC family protein [Archangiaceae bacterium]